MHPPKPESPRSANCQLLYFTSYSLTADGAVLASTAGDGAPAGSARATATPSNTAIIAASQRIGRS